MEAEEFYRDADPLWCQGDIISQIPHIHLKPPLIAVRKETTRSGEKLAPFEYPFDSPEEGNSANASPRGGFKFDTGDEVVAFCQLAFGMILTHGCEMDKDLKHRQVALIRPLSVVPLEGQEIIRMGHNLSACHLPAYGEIMGESYVDFRRTTTLHPNFLRVSGRVASLTDDAVKYIQTQFFRFVTRRDVSPESLDRLSLLP